MLSRLPALAGISAREENIITIKQKGKKMILDRFKTKKCSVCGKELPLSDFYGFRGKNGVVHRDSYCMKCRSAKSLRYFYAHHEAILQRKRSNYTPHPRNE